MKIILILIIIGGTMAHVKGHINVPAREMKESETKTSFFESFKNKLPKFEFKKEPKLVTPDKVEIKVFKNGGKVTKY
jgi:hypothetical protein|tara:strand:- start:1 stop:231 length:231 start_codon:yes stop_codon:yes gene_type:complete